MALTHAVGPIVLFVGGPEDGRITSGADAEFFMIQFSDPVPEGDAGVRNVADARLGKRVRVGASRMMQSGDHVPIEKVPSLYEKYGVGKEQQAMNVYELIEIDGNVFVYRHVEPETA